MDAKERMIELNSILMEASNAYYNEDREIMSNFEYDKLYDELVELENSTGIILSNSITQSVGSDVVSSLKKVKHSEPMLSLSKTKSVNELDSWLGDNDGCLSWKLDGLTVVMTYENGKLASAVTRGNGKVGEDITAQAKHFINVPLTINSDETVIVRGEAVIDYNEFDRINNLFDAESQFKNPRNLASGTVRNLDLKVLDERHVRFIVFNVIEGIESNSYNERLDAAEALGFEVVVHHLVSHKTLKNVIEEMTNEAENYEIPVDGLVVFYDDIAYGKSLGATSHSPRNGKAFKWADECYETIIRDIEWSVSRTGRINPVAVFDTVEIDGTDVSRASVHNITYIKDMKLGIGDNVTVFKANMIIPQIAENKTQSLNDINDVLPDKCPICGGNVEVRNDGSAEFLYCLNDDCSKKKIDEINWFISKLQIMGISDMTINKLIDNGLLNCREDLFFIKNHKDEFCSIDGLGEKSFNTLTEAADNIRVPLSVFITSLGIDDVSFNTAKAITEEMTFEEMLDANADDYTTINGIGNVTANKIVKYFNENRDEVKALYSHIRIEDEDAKTDNDFISGKTFAITGSVEIFKNRKEFQQYVENNNGKVSGVSSKTDYLVTNDTSSGSSKNKKAQELGVSIITEAEFCEMSGYSN